MRTLRMFIVKVDKPIKDTITTSGGLELHLDARFNEFEHRQTAGEVVCPPVIIDSPVKEGDTLYFHHLVVVEKGQKMQGEDNLYVVKCDEKYTIGNQAIAYKCKDTNEITPLFGWTLLKPYVPEVKKESEIIEIIKLKEEPAREGVVAFDCPAVQDLGLKVGDVVGFAKDMDYRIKIEGEEYYRVRSEDLLYVRD